MTDLRILWPDEHVERIEAARGRLDVAAERLIARGAEDVTAALAEVFDRWSRSDSRWRRRLLEEHPAAAGFSPEVVAAGLDLGLGAWSGDALRGALEAERRALLSGPGRVLLPFGSTSLVLAGSIPMPSLLQPVLSLALLSPVLVKSASRDPVTPRLLAESIFEVDEEIGRAIEVVAFPADDDASLGRFLAAECVVASGSDATIDALGSRVSAGQRFVPYGHRLSIAVLDASCLDEHADSLASSVATDVSLWDQAGCLSPVAVYVVGRDAAAAAARWSKRLGDAMETCATALPRGEAPPEAAAAIVHERDAAAMRAAGGDAVHVHAGAGTSWTVVTEPDARWRGSPLHRFVRVHPVSDADALADALRPIARHLSSVGLAASPALRDVLEARMFALGASRICAPGRMQAPPIDWPHDGLPILAPLARVGAGEPTGTP